MAVKLPKFPEFPEFVPYNFDAFQPKTIKEDELFYGRSDLDFKKRHPGIRGSETALEEGIADDFSGKLPDAVQNEFMRSGLGDALTAFGGPGALAPGSGGSAAVARGLGLRTNDYRNESIDRLMTAESLFPRRTFGMSGADYATLEIANTAGENNWNQANYSNELNQSLYGYQAQAQQQNSDASADAGKKSALIGGGAAIAGAAVLAIAL